MNSSMPEFGKRGERPPSIRVRSPVQKPENDGPKGLVILDKMMMIVVILCIGIVSIFGIAVSTTIGGYRSGYSWGGASGGSAHDATFGGFGRAGSGHVGGAGS
jgi:hypothetical protein